LKFHKPEALPRLPTRQPTNPTHPATHQLLARQKRRHHKQRQRRAAPAAAAAAGAPQLRRGAARRRRGGRRGLLLESLLVLFGEGLGQDVFEGDGDGELAGDVEDLVEGG
jgi:hypothetical protein